MELWDRADGLHQHHSSISICSSEIQSAIMVEDGGTGGSSTEQKTVAFTDESPGYSTGWAGTGSTIGSSDQTVNIGLSDFLSRPVRIYGFTWNESDPIGTAYTFSPWNLFFSDPAIKNKLNNFAYISCDLKVKVLVNASPFYYGSMLMNYQPLPAVTPSTIQVPSGSGTRYFIPMSQRPHIWIHPQHNEAGEILLPWFYHQNWLNIQSNTDTINMGTLTATAFTVLQSANGVSGQGVSVQVFAWAENVRLSGPSCGLALQGGDEYGEGVVSAPASTVARAAKYFEKIPIIGPFATATRIGAGAVSSIASLFGWTNVPVISDVPPMRPSAFPQLASTTIGFPAEKLTVDPKNELTVDPGVLGMDNKDEMVINYITNRESYLGWTQWNTTNNVDDILFTSLVTPLLLDSYTDANNNTVVYHTTLSWLTPLFKNWRGDIIFRFRFVASPFHKGRVRISYDPTGTSANNIINTTATYSTVKTHIVDLGEEQDIELRIPYQQATSFLQVQNSNTAVNWSTSLTPSFTRNPVFDNGTICMRVQTALTAPVATAPVPVLIFVRAADNFEFANPGNQGPTLTTFAPQSEDVVVTDTTSEILGTGVPEFEPQRNLVCFGEVVMSLRQLLRRQVLSMVTTPIGGSGTEYHLVFRERISRWPMPYGFDPNGIHTATKLLTAGNANFNFACVTPFNYITPAYVGMRGSMQLTINLNTNQPVGHIRVYRDTSNSGNVATTAYVQSGIGTYSGASRFYMANLPNGASGQALTNQITNSGLTVQLPNYTRFKFQSTNPGAINSLPSATATDIDGYVVETSYTPGQPYTGSPTPTNVGAKQWRYFGIGTDFNVHFFLNVPTYWVYSTLPLSV